MTTITNPFQKLLSLFNRNGNEDEKVNLNNDRKIINIVWKFMPKNKKYFIF